MLSCDVPENTYESLGGSVHLLPPMFTDCVRFTFSNYRACTLRTAATLHIYFHSCLSSAAALDFSTFFFLSFNVFFFVPLLCLAVYRNCNNFSAYAIPNSMICYAMTSANKPFCIPFSFARLLASCIRFVIFRHTGFPPFVFLFSVAKFNRNADPLIQDESGKRKAILHQHKVARRS